MRRTGVLVLGLGLGLSGCNESSAADEQGPYQTAEVQFGDLDIRVEAAGQVEPITVVDVKSKASGEVLRVHVETGDRVERGALLAEVDPRDVRNLLDQAEADLDVAQARLSVAQAQRDRAEELREANVVTAQEYESAVLEAANARASMVKAQTNLQLARERSGDVTIRAPISGTVIERPVEAGQIIASASANVSGGTTLLLMADLSQMQVRTLVDETDIGRLRAGQLARVTVEAYSGREFVGSVYKIEPQAVVEQNVTMFPVLVRLDNRDGLLKPRMNAEVAIEVASREGVVLVPNAAVVSMADAMAAASMFGLEMGPGARAAAGRGPAGDPTARRRGADPGSRAGAPQTADRAATGEGEGDGEDGNGDGDGDCEALLVRARQDRSALTEAERTRARECFQAGGSGAIAGGGVSRTVASVADMTNSQPRPAMVFVLGEDGPEARRVVLGLNDWDRTEVIRGLEEGEKVILISVARLQQQQEELMNRIRSRSGFPGSR